MDYEELLDRGHAELPESVKNTERFEIPKVRGHIQGNKTIISNFFQIADALRRTPEHVLKYVLKELATPGEFHKNFLIFGSKIPASRINEKIQNYANEYVLCPECKKPDTKIIREEGFLFLKCTACGARHSVKAKI